MREALRYFFIAILIFLGVSLYYQWQQDLSGQTQQTSEQAQAQNQIQENSVPKEAQEIPVAQTKETNVPAATKANAPTLPLISVSTNVYDAKIDPQGGDIVYLKLKQFKSAEEAEKNEAKQTGFVLMSENENRYYIAQSGLTGAQGPDVRGVGRAVYQSKQNEYNLESGKDRIEVDLNTKTSSGTKITKRYVFLKDSYDIGVTYLIDNEGSEPYKANFYARLKRKAPEDTGSRFLGVQTFTGAAIYTPSTPYKKISFSDFKSKPVKIDVDGGWAAMVEHYFVSAWVPSPGITYNYQTSDLGNDFYAIGFVGPETVVQPKTQTSINANLYAGPQVTESLAKLSPGLDLTVDYGILWPICKPIFWLLKKLFSFTGNWGVAIILVTVIIKLLFYKLSESSYRSMGNMRKLQPRIEALKEKYGDDKQKFSQAVMELYKKEKINPLGGCLPILIQIPVFIALYYVLLGSVELRDAPFILWIHDLSYKDPYYVLPVLMGISMWVQQKLNPQPPDPVQAKVMMTMPIIFTILFLNFPSGLVLYWLVNNILSIAQQWYITRKIENSATVHHGAK